MLCVRPLRSLTIASSMLVWLGVATLYSQETRTKTVIFAGDLIDGSSDDPRGPQTLVIEDGVIQSIEPGRATPAGRRGGHRSLRLHGPCPA